MKSKRLELLKNKRFREYLSFEYGIDPDEEIKIDLRDKEDLYWFNYHLIQWTTGHCAVIYPHLYPTEKQLNLIYSESLEGKRNKYAYVKTK